MELLRTTIAVGRSQQLALRYRSQLEIRRDEFTRYLRKAANLAFCYQGFGSTFNFKQAEGAGSAAFLSCAYDVTTDWRGENPKWQTIFEQIVRREAQPLLANEAIDLYRKDKTGALKHDGLERGIVAFRFILEMMGLTEDFSKKTNIDNLGILLQIVDDVLDYDNDTATGEINCINSPNGRDYLYQLITEMTDRQIKILFPNSRLLFEIIRNARIKARRLLEAV